MQEERFTTETAIVVGGVDYGEADRIAHLLTARGRLDVFAHGARKSRRRFAGALEPFQTVEVTIDAGRTSRGMPTLQSAVVREPRLAIRDDLAKIALCSYVAELGAALAPEGDEAAELYGLVEGVLDRVARKGASIALRRAFELLMLDVIGHRPCLDACAICGARFEPGTNAFLDFSKGGLLCGEHREGAQEIGPVTREWMELLFEQPPRSLDEHAGIDPRAAERASRALARPARNFYSAWLGRALKSEALLDNLAL